MKQNIYDNRNFSNKYDEIRRKSNGLNANDLIEIPNFRSMVSNFKDKRVLDLGCEYGNIRIWK